MLKIHEEAENGATQRLYVSIVWENIKTALIHLNEKTIVIAIIFTLFCRDKERKRRKFWSI